MRIRKADIRFGLWILGVVILGVILAFGRVPESEPQWQVESMAEPLAFFVPQELARELKECGICEAPFYVEEQLRKNPWVKAVNVHATPTGNYVVKIEEEQPVFRLLSWNEYLSSNGVHLPEEAGKNFRVPVVTGVLPAKSKQKFWEEFTALGRIIQHDAFWNAQIQQLIVDKNQEVVLIPRVGNHSIVLGTCTQAEEKLRKLMLLYREGFSYTGWYNYKEINIALSNQIVCSKR